MAITGNRGSEVVGLDVSDADLVVTLSNGGEYALPLPGLSMIDNGDGTFTIVTNQTPGAQAP